MEQLNKVELAGTVGSVNVFEVGDGKVARFSLCCDTLYFGANGGIVVESTWVSISAWSHQDGVDIDAIKRGGNVRVEGRLRAIGYTDADGNSRTTYEVVANKIQVIN